MADDTADDTPYVVADPGALIRSGDWNEIQIQARREIHGHDHTGGDQGVHITGAAIDPASDVTVHNLSVTGHLDVRDPIKGTARDVLKAIDDLARHTPPIGSVFAFAGSTPPPGYLLCDGSTVSRVDFPDLFAVVGTTYGGNGQPMFKLPDLCGRVVAGAGAGTGLTPRELGQSLGAEAHTLTSGEVPLHTHKGTTENAGAHGHTGTTGPGGEHAHSGTTHSAPSSVSAAGFAGDNFVPDQVASNTGHTHTFDTSRESDHAHAFTTSNQSDHDHAHAFTTDGGTGGGQPHSNMQPLLILNYIIRC